RATTNPSHHRSDLRSSRSSMATVATDKASFGSKHRSERAPSDGQGPVAPGRNPLSSPADVATQSVTGPTSPVPVPEACDIPSASVVHRQWTKADCKRHSGRQSILRGAVVVLISDSSGGLGGLHDRSLRNPSSHVVPSAHLAGHAAGCRQR